MSEMSNERLLFREATDLAIRMQDDPANPALLATVRGWIARGPDHQLAWARVAQIHGMTGKVLTIGDKPDGSPIIARRSLIIAGLLGLGGAAAGGWYLPRALLSARADHQTAAGEQKRIDLPDGSVITLGPDSAVAVRMTGAGREVDLLQGVAFFDVASDGARPFRVTASGVSVTVLGTAFDVSLDAGYVTVSVAHGRVNVASARARETLGGGDWLTLNPEASASGQGRREPSEIGSWRGGMLIAEQETVSALIARIARWQDSRVVIADPGLGARVVSGVFDLADPYAALESVVRPFGAKVRNPLPFLIVISSI